MRFLKNKLTVAIVLLSVTFLILISQTIKSDKFSFFQNGASISFNSIGGTIYKVNNSIKGSVNFVFNFSKIKKENEEIIKRNSELESKLLEYETLKDENTKLKQMFDFKNQRSEYNYVGCDIIDKAGGSLLDQFIINKGSKDGIKKKMIAITEQGLVGQVVSIGTNSAIVQTISNENLAVGGMIESTKENSGMVKGYKDNNSKLLAKLYYLPLESTIKKNDVISTSGLDRLYPKSIRIGYVIDVEEDKGKVMKNAVIQPYVDFNKIQQVFIVIPKNEVDVKY